VDDPDEPGAVARDDPGELLALGLLVVRVGVEGESGNLVLLAALEDCLFAEALIDRPVLLTDAAGVASTTISAALSIVSTSPATSSPAFSKAGFFERSAM
jgi:hypothetical protein